MRKMKKISCVRRRKQKTKQRKMKGEMIRKLKQVCSNKIRIEELEIGDHIYTWRYGKIYAHHGIYVHGGKVIHFTPVAGREVETGTSIDRVIFSSSSSHRSESHCPRCGDCPRNGGVNSSCLECFLSGGKLYRFRYGVSKDVFYAQVRGTCTLVHADSPEEVLHRAETLLNNGFGNYKLFKNNCEHFAIYCKTSYIGTACGQVASLKAAARASIWQIIPITSIFTVAVPAASMGVETAFLVMTGISIGGGAVLGGAMAYCINRYRSDIGVRKGMEKIPVEMLVNERAI